MLNPPHITELINLKSCDNCGVIYHSKDLKDGLCKYCEKIENDRTTN